MAKRRNRKAGKESPSLKIILYFLSLFFILIICFIFIPSFDNFKHLISQFIAVIALAFFVFGIILLVSTIKARIKGKLKLSLMFTSISAIGIPACIILHNLVYALFILLFGENFWQGGDEPFFFILGLVVLPILFIISIISSLILIHKK